MNEGLKLLGEDILSTGSFGDNTYGSHVLAGFNVILRDVYIRNPDWGILEAQTTFPTVASTQTYDLSSSSVVTSGQNTFSPPSRIRSILHPDNFELEKVTQGQYYKHVLPLDYQETSLDEGTPSLWWIERELIYLYPVPSAAETLTVKYVLPLSTTITTSNLTSTTVVPFVEAHLNMLILGAKWLAAARLKDPDTLLFKAEFKEAFLLSVLEDDKAPDQLEVDTFWTRGMI